MTPLLLFALATLPLVNNCSGTLLSGNVRDPTAALIPGASLTVDTIPAKPSGSDGRFTLPCLAPGSHTLTVRFPGFTPSTVTVKLPRNVPLDLTLVPATVQTTIDVDAVTDAPSSVNTVGPSQTLAGKQLQQLADDPDDLLRQLQQLASAVR